MCSAVNTDSCYGRTRRRYVSIVAPVGKQAISYRDECERVEVERRFSASFENARISSGDSRSEQKLGTCSVDINLEAIFRIDVSI